MEKIKYFFCGRVNDTISFVLEKQLKDKVYWKRFVEVFKTREDIRDEGWRGEYFGKMMRGACMMYSLTQDEELYGILTETVNELLSTQDEFGRISTYPVEREFCGWDVWSRKYVMVGLEYYRSICKDKILSDTILTALKKHADYIITKIGTGDGQIPITQTTTWWGGVASCSILEPMVELYAITRDRKYLDFAEYILSTGGVEGGNLIEHALNQDKMPYEYEEVKAYETMSFFEGVLAYYEITGKREYLDAVQRFVENVHETDITIIGCAGCTHELFDNSKIKQTEYSETIMQETCVTVTWMRLLARLNSIAPNVKYLEWIETSALNALYGAINSDGLAQYSFERKEYVSPLAFDSYSPLYNNKRGRGIGGYKEFLSGGHYGCCAAIAAAGIALYPLEAIKFFANEIVVDFFVNGTVERFFENGMVKIEIASKYPACDKVTVKIDSDMKNICLKVRIPSYANGATLNGVPISTKGGYAVVENAERIRELSFMLNYSVQSEHLNGKTAFTYGPYVLALDQAKGERLDFTASYQLEGLDFEMLPTESGEQVRLKARGEREFLFTDYASCGKNWFNDANMTVWIKNL